MTKSSTKEAISIPDTQIIEVWSHNVEEELLKIAHLVPEYNNIAMDTEFPGCYLTRDQMPNVEPYIFIKSNVDQLSLIQLGITLSNDAGEMPSGVNTWQFNLKYDLS